MSTARDDFGRVALGAPSLREVWVVAIPDCLLVRAWARGAARDAETSAAHLGSFFRSGTAVLYEVASGGAPSAVTIESADAVIRVERLSDELVAAFMFDRSAPLGLVGVQAQQLRGHLERTIIKEPVDGEPATAVPEPVAEGGSRDADPTQIGMLPPEDTETV